MILWSLQVFVHEVSQFCVHSHGAKSFLAFLLAENAV